MSSRVPFPLCCLLLLCLPLAILFTLTTPRSGSTDSDAENEPLVSVVRTPRETSEEDNATLPPIPEDDDTLFRVAAGVNQEVPPGSPKKLAFMFLTTTPLPFAPLWELFFNQTPKTLYNVYVHADPTRRYHPPFSGVFSNRVVRSSRPAFRYTPTLIAAARRLLAQALIHDSGNYRFALLSPSCVPLHSFNFTFTTLVSSSKSFIEILKNEPGQYDRWAARGVDALLPEVRFDDFRIGSQFWVLTRTQARLVTGDVTLWEKFNKPCVRRGICYPEEHYFATLIHMRDPRGCVPATLTHVDWSVRAGGHPRRYGASDVGPRLIQKLRMARPRYGDFGGIDNASDPTVMQRSDPFLFARKFSPAALEPLMTIAKDVILKD